MKLGRARSEAAAGSGFEFELAELGSTAEVVFFFAGMGGDAGRQQRCIQEVSKLHLVWTLRNE